MRLDTPDGRTIELRDGNERVILRSDEDGVLYVVDLKVMGQLDAVEDFSTPVNAVAATATLTYENGTNPTATKTVTVNGKAYKFVAGPVADEGDVLVAGNADATMTNLARAIEKTGGTPGTDYLVALAHPTVSASISTASDVVTLTARTKGAAGNAYPLTTTETTITVSDFATEGTGIDGTVGAKGDMRFDENYIYFCVAVNSVSGANWKKATLA